MLLVWGIVFLLSGLLLLLGGGMHSGPVPDANFTTCDKHTPSAGVDSAQIYRRVWQLYVAHIFVFVMLSAAVCYATLHLQNQTYSEDFGIDNFIDEPQIAIIKVLLLQYQPQFLHGLAGSISPGAPLVGALPAAPAHPL